MILQQSKKYKPLLYFYQIPSDFGFLRVKEERGAGQLGGFRMGIRPKPPDAAIQMVGYVSCVKHALAFDLGRKNVNNVVELNKRKNSQKSTSVAAELHP
jgi:hypothetical protein